MKFLGILGTLCMVIAWWLISVSGWVNPILLPPPNAVAIEAVDFVTSASGLGDLWLTFQRIFIAFFLSVVIGISLGMIFGLVKPLAGLFEFPVDFFRSLPVTALYPLCMLFFGVGDESKLILVIFAASLINLVHTMLGVKNCSEMRLKTARTMRLTRIEIFYRILLPESLPNIISGLRISLSLVLILVVVLEMFTGNTPGIGKRIYDAKLMFRIKEMYAAIIIVGILGYVLNKVISFFDSKFVHWRGK